eukprot:436224_1
MFRLTLILTLFIENNQAYTPHFVHKWKDVNFNLNAYSNIHPSSGTHYVTKPVQRDKNHEMIHEKSHAIYMRHKACTEHALRDAMQMIYPHRIEHSSEMQISQKKNRETKWKNRRHLFVSLTPKRIEDIHSHPCVEKVIPLYYSEDEYDWM